MLSLKASRADNFYYGSVDDELVKKKKEKEKKKLTKKDYSEIKFEIPYTIICLKCNVYIYKGERFKSERRTAGYYLSTCFYSFSIFCKKCTNKIVIETNPQNCSYDIIEGAKKKNEDYKNILTEGGKNNINTINFELNKKKRGDPFLLLEINALQKNRHLPLQPEGNPPVGRGNLRREKRSKGEQAGKAEEAANAKEPAEEKAGAEAEAGAETETETETDEPDESDGASSLHDHLGQSDEDMNEVIRQNYRRNSILKSDFTCNSNLRKQFRDIKKDKIKTKEENKKKNIFIDIVNDPYEDLKIKNFLLVSEKYKKTMKEKTLKGTPVNADAFSGINEHKQVGEVGTRSRTHLSSREQTYVNVYTYTQVYACFIPMSIFYTNGQACYLSRSPICSPRIMFAHMRCKEYFAI
ncbi:conserved Plasmodium protein, unknown function [Plasmodium ovale wallikeri]|uniref:CWC16 domain-containing protein n=1 Tax=Plasmodium ovale wallikeri TaxID=864142 RepID=A0A1A9A109_PLAOA|nr:conserved Plasmodium protein, unknown function [Plasmodium ovale wallikeri]